MAPDWFPVLSEKRRQWWESTRQNNYERGIRQSTVDKYADPVHFVYELLQNAEDQGATQALFSLSKQRLRFVHNGAPFTPEDVENITGLGNSQKPEAANKIGRFGIGFKSVFTITERPRIYATLGGQPFAFAIENLVVPVLLTEDLGLCKEGQTQFTLPLLPAKAAPVYQGIQERLRMLSADTLLFLRSLRTIRWIVEGVEEGVLRAARAQNGRLIRLAEEAGPLGRPVNRPEVAYLVYANEVCDIPGADRRLVVSIAYRMEKERIVAEKGQGTANVYFPTREKTGLRFRLHAPFLLSDNRANIKENCPENTLLIRACAETFVKSLPDLKARGLLTPDAWNALPIRREDFEGSAFRPFYDEMYHAAKTQEILPTQQGSSKRHVRASHARITDSRPLKSLLGESQLTALYEGSSRDPVCWLHEHIQKNVTRDLWDYLLHDLQVDEVDASKFARRVDAAFLAAQTDAWMVEFYAYLADNPALWRAGGAGRERGPLRNRPIVRLEAGTGAATHVPPFADNGAPNAYLPLPETDAGGFPTVKRALARHGEVRKFFSDLGLKQPDLADRVITFVLPRYRQTAPSIGDTSYALDITEIAEAVEGLPPGGPQRHALAQALLETAFVRAARADDPSKTSFKRPTEVYQRTPDTQEWFRGNSVAWLVHPILEKHPRWPALQRYLSGLTMTALLAAPRLRARVADENGHVEIVNRHGVHERGVGGFDPEADIDGLTHALKDVTPARAKLLWRLLAQHPQTITGIVESSRHLHFGDAARTEHISLLGRACQDARWLPHRADGKLHFPADIRLVDLPEDWDKRSAGAKEAAIRLGLSDPEEQQIADKLGIPADLLAQVVDSYRRDPGFLTGQLARWRGAPEMPAGGDMAYPERRGQKVAQEAQEARDKEYRLEKRSVRVSDGGIREEAKAYLRHHYVNPDHEMICQICREVMPFTLEDGSFYFEAVTCLKEVRKEFKQNYLALCPLCAALYQYGNWENAPGALREAILREPGPEFALYLAGEEERIWFHSLHLGDLKAMLAVIGSGDSP